MEKVLHFDSPREVYVADACVISCFDARFDAAMRRFLKRRGVTLYDHVKIPGAAKPLAAPECEGDREFMLRMIRTSIALHRSARVLMIGHNDCGAYIGRPVPDITSDILKAADTLRRAEPSLSVECYFADFDGIYRVDAAASGGGATLG